MCFQKPLNCLNPVIERQDDWPFKIKLCCRLNLMNRLIVSVSSKLFFFPNYRNSLLVPGFVAIAHANFARKLRQLIMTLQLYPPY